MNSLPLQAALPRQPIDQLTVQQHRKPLARTLRKLASGELTVGFAGGSITADYPQNWPNPLVAWLVETFPQVRITIENTAIGATGSDSGCVRADRELIDRGCDLTFVEYAVNDFGETTQRRNRSREGLIRKLLAAGQDVILVYTYRQEFYAEMIEGKVPASIAELEVLAEHYGIGSVWVGLSALREVCAGRLRWEEWLPDCLHPNFRGSWSYAEVVADFLSVEISKEKANASEPSSARVLPPSLFDRNWQNATVLPFSSVRTTGPWVIKRLSCPEHVDQALETHAPGAKLAFEFTGFGLVLIFQYGKRSAEYSYRIDGGEWIPMVRPRYDWSGDRGMVRANFITDDLAPGTHQFEMVVTHGDRSDCTGTECRLGTIGVLA